MAFSQNVRSALIWNMKNLEETPVVLRLKGKSAHFPAKIITSDGRLSVISDNGTIESWDLDLDRLLELAREVGGRNLSHSEWSEFFGRVPYRRTFPNLPDGDGAAENRQAQQDAHSGTAAANLSVTPAH